MSGISSCSLQASFVPAAGVNLWEMRVGDMHSPGAGSRGRGCLLLRVLQRGYRSLLQTGESQQAACYSTNYARYLQPDFP
jgi:hypothetical protein